MSQLAPGTAVNSLPAPPLSDAPPPAAALLADPTVTPASTPAPAEPGYLTTEFWMAVVVQLLGLLALVGVIQLPSATVQAIVGLVGLVAPQVAYAISRGIRKSGTPA